MIDNLCKNILATVTYYDILDYPMTSFEIWKYLVSWDVGHETIKTKSRITLEDVMRKLKDDEIRKYLDEYQGFYFLKGRRYLVGQRIEKNKISEKKFEIILRAVKWMRLIPFVRMVAVTGRMAMKNADRKSDLDLFVVLKSGHIFTGRILVTLVVHCLGLRRYKNKITNRICLNYYVTDKSLEISVKDLFASSEYMFFLPLFGTELFEKFQKNNSWISKFKVNYEISKIGNLKAVTDSRAAIFIRRIGERMVGFRYIENKLKKYQMDRVRNDERTNYPGSLVLVNDKELVFLPEPQGPNVFEKYKINFAYFDKIKLGS